MNLESTFPKDSFVFYKSFYESIKLLPKKTQLDIYIAICEFSLYGNLVELPPKTMAYLTLIIPQIEANFRRREVGTANGFKGGRPRKNKPMGFEEKNQWVSNEETNGLQTKNPNANANANANANVNVNGEGFPTLAEVEAYARAEGIQTNCKGFYDYYNTPDSSGRRWADMQGNPVNWKRKLRTWATLDKAVTAARTKPAKNHNTLDNYKVEGVNHPQLEDIEMDLDEL